MVFLITDTSRWILPTQMKAGFYFSTLRMTRKSSPGGYVAIHRKIFSDPLYFREPFTMSAAWIDLILLANHTDGGYFSGKVWVKTKRGQVGRSQKSLAARWLWTRARVNRFLNWLENDQRIEQLKNRITTLVTILNYDKYQISGQRTVPPTVPPTVQPATTNNKNIRITKESGGEQFAYANAPPLDKPYAVGPPKSAEEIARELLTKKFKP